MQEKELNGVSMIDNSNSGMDILSAEKALEYALLKKKDEKKSSIILVLGEEASQVCEGLPPASVQGFIENSEQNAGISYLSERGCGQLLLKTLLMQAAFGRAIEASELAGTGDIILSSVKCFR
jgi:hypothetical protein